MRQNIILEYFGTQFKQGFAIRILGGEVLLEQDVEVCFKTLFFKGQESWQMLELIHVSLLPKPVSQIYFRVEFLREFQLGIKIL